MVIKDNSQSKVDPITLSVLWAGLVGIAEEMGSTLRRTAFSEAVRDGDDFSTCIFDRHGRLAAQGNFTPGHLGSMPYILQHIRQIYPESSLKEGDCIFGNDSSIGSGHYPDCFLVTPIFLNGSIIGYAVNIAHHCDIGGATPGSQAIEGISEAYQEGLRLLPVKLVREGEFDEGIIRIIEGNVRMPENVLGDIRAQRNANHVGLQRFVKLAEDFGLETFEEGIEEILSRSEAHTRERIQEIPDGVYSFDDCLDDYGPGTDPIQVSVDITVAGSDIEINFDRSSDQVNAGMNCYLNYTRAYAMFAVKVFSDALLPQNDGVTRPISITSRPGSFFNATFPAPSGGRAVNQVRIFDAINGALAKTLPAKAMGAFSHWANVNIGGTDDRKGRGFVFYDVIYAGYGGRSYKDGVNAMAPVMNCPNIPVEIHESQNPILVRRIEIIPDSEGAGKYRGGCGLRKDIELRTGEAVMTQFGDRHKNAPYGIFGGQSGCLASTILNPDKEATVLASKGTRKLKSGDVVSFRLAGAGGYGPVEERDPELVKRDISEGYVSKKRALEVYGYK